METYNISDYIPVRNIPKTKGADTVIPLGNDFQSPPQKVSSMGEAGKGGGGGLWILNGIALTLPWLPETFLARFPVSVAASPLVAYGRRRVGLRPTPKIPAAREKNLWYPGYPDLKDMLNCATIL